MAQDRDATQAEVTVLHPVALTPPTAEVLVAVHRGLLAVPAGRADWFDATETADGAVMDTRRHA